MKNEQLQKLIQELKKKSIEEKVKIWKRIASDLEKPTRNRRIVNLSKIDKYTKNDEIIIVPGKVLGSGDLNKKLTIAAYAFSEQALDKIKSNDSKALHIEELMKNNPKGSKVRIIG